jgi:hypothetical protein
MIPSARVVRLVLAASAVGMAVLIAVARKSTEAPPSWVAAAIAAAAACAAAVGLVLAVRTMRARDGHAWQAAGEALAMLGLLVLVGAGLSNWLLEYRGLLLLQEGDAVVLGPESHLRDLTVGPLGRLTQPSGLLQLDRVRLLPAEAGFVAESSLRYTDDDGKARDVMIRTGGPARVGPVTLHQGAFGFVARIVVQHQGTTLFDRWVPIESKVDERRAIAFDAKLDVGQAGVTLAVAVGLDHLDEAMKGHPVLGVELRKGDEVLGAGELLPGHGATMTDGWHVGFGGLKRWSELDLSRESFPRTALGGIALTLAGTMVFAAARWRRA